MPFSSKKQQHPSHMSAMLEEAARSPTVSTSKSSRTASTSTASASRPRRTVAPTVRDANLVQLAHRTKRKIQWNKILRGSDPTAAQWKWLENERNFSIYTKQNDHGASQFAVLAIGVVKGSVPELASLLIATSQNAYVRKMEALYGKTFKHGMYVNDVESEPVGPTELDQHDDAPMQLSVRTATFEKLGGWLASHDEWCFLESVAFHRERQVLEKLITTLSPQDAFAADRGSLAGSSGSGSSSVKLFSGVTAGFRVEPDQYETSDVPPGMEDTRDSRSVEEKASATPRVATRVHFYADYAGSGSSSVRESLSARFGRFAVPKLKHSTSDKAVKQRLVHLAKSCDRLSHLVRRRRLGMQLVVDQKRFLHAASASCFCCDKTLGVIAKVCRVCGQGVCSDCSAKYERETHTRLSRGGRVRLEDVRVCDPCLTRIDNADYSSISDAALAGPGVHPNPPGAKPAAADLKDLLHDALMQAPSPSRKDAVLSVIRCVLDQERASEPTPPTTPSPLPYDHHSASTSGFEKPRVLLTPVSTDRDYVDALDYLNVETVAHTEPALLANPEGRPYAIDTRTGSPDAQLAYPMPENERQRLDAIDYTHALGHGTYAELDIICEIAAKELGSFASLVSVITSDEQRVIGANMDFLRELVIKREDAFCAHAIMGTQPLEVPHPEADIRFSKIVPVTALGARYYCGFPIVADDEHGSIIGSLCVIDNKANALTESQYAVLRKLAATASKVVKIEGAKRRNSNTSSIALSAPPSPMAQTSEL